MEQLWETDYAMLERQAAALLEDERNFIANAANLASLLYHEMLHVNWAGFYFGDAGGLVLGPFSGRPACTRLPAGRGVCGTAVKDRSTVIVDDVHAFADHIACDSASQSEIVVPLLKDGKLFGVLDIDSPLKSRFSQADAEGIERIAKRFVALTDIPAALLAKSVV